MATNQSPDPRYGIRGRGRPPRPAKLAQLDPDDPNTKTKEQHITIPIGGMIGTLDAQPPYDTTTLINQNLEPHRGGYKPRQNDQPVIQETNNNKKPIACVKLGNYTVYPIQYLLRGHQLPDWITIAKRGNTAYLKIDNNYIISIGLIGTITNFNSGTNKLSVQTSFQLPHFYHWGGYIQVKRSLFSYSGMTIDENGIATLNDIQPVSGIGNTADLTTDEPVFWVCSNIVEPAPKILSAQMDNTSQTQPFLYFPIVSPIVFGIRNKSIPQNNVNHYKLTIDLTSTATEFQQNYPLVASNDDENPLAWFSAWEVASNSNWDYHIYNRTHSSGLWAGLTIFDTAVPKWHRNPDILNEIVNNYNSIPNANGPAVPRKLAHNHNTLGGRYLLEENFRTGTIETKLANGSDHTIGSLPTFADFFRPYVTPSDDAHYFFRKKNDTWELGSNSFVLGAADLFKTVLEGCASNSDTFLSNSFGGSRTSWGALRYLSGIQTGGSISTQVYRTLADYDFRCVRYPPRAHITPPATAYDPKGDYHHFGYKEFALGIPYRSRNRERFAIPKGTTNDEYVPLLTPAWDVYSENTNQIWCSRWIGTPFCCIEDDPNFAAQIWSTDNGINFHLAASLSYGFKYLNGTTAKEAVIATRIIANGSKDWARIVIRCLNPEAFQPPRDESNNFNILISSFPENTTSTTAVENAAINIRSFLRNYYELYFKRNIVKPDGATLDDDLDYPTSDIYARPKYAFKVRESEHQRILPNFQNLSGQYESVDIIIPGIEVYGFGQFDPDPRATLTDISDILRFYVIKASGKSTNTGDPEIYIEENPSESNLVPLEIVSYDRMTVDRVRESANTDMDRKKSFVRSVKIRNLRLRAPISALTDQNHPPVGLEIRVLVRYTSDTRSGESSDARVPHPPAGYRDPAINSAREYPACTDVVIRAYRNNSSTDDSNKPRREYWALYFPVEPAKETQPTLKALSACILHGETYGTQSPVVSLIDRGTFVRMRIQLPNAPDPNNFLAKRWLLIGSQTVSGQVVAYKKELTNTTPNTLEIEFPASQLSGEAPFHFSEIAPSGKGEITSYNGRIVHRSVSHLQISGLHDGLSWRINPSEETDGISIPLPDADLVMGNHTGKIFVANARGTHMLVGDTAFNLTLIPTETSVTPVPQVKLDGGTLKPIPSNLIDGLAYLGEDGFYLGETQLLMMPETHPTDTLGIFILNTSGEPYLIIEKKSRYEIYMHDKHTPGYIAWTIDKANTNDTQPRLKHAEIVGGYLHLVAPSGLNISSTNDAQVLSVGSDPTPVSLGKVLYRSGSIYLPTGLRVRKAKLQIVETNLTPGSNCAKLTLYRKATYNASDMVSETTFKVGNPDFSRTLPVIHKGHKLETIAVELKWLDASTTIESIMLVPTSGMRW
jgi:hypothetical protein